jgi:sec-independent protein translocase protein TatA
MLPHFTLGELVILLIVVLLLFGPQRLPDLAASFGKSIRSFKQGIREAASEDPAPRDLKRPPKA